MGNIELQNKQYHPSLLNTWKEAFAIASCRLDGRLTETLFLKTEASIEDACGVGRANIYLSASLAANLLLANMEPLIATASLEAIKSQQKTLGKKQVHYGRRPLIHRKC